MKAAAIAMAGSLVFSLQAQSQVAPGTDQWEPVPGAMIGFVAVGYRLASVVMEPGEAHARSYYLEQTGSVIRCVEGYFGGNLGESLAAMAAKTPAPQPQLPTLMAQCYRLTAPKPRAG
jgi:hypothetical protein